MGAFVGSSAEGTVGAAVTESVFAGAAGVRGVGFVADGAIEGSIRLGLLFLF